jgi:hypothetical protein
MSDKKLNSCKCKKCGKTKIDSEFYSDGRGGFRTNACKDCAKDISKVSYNTKKLLQQKAKKNSELDMERKSINDVIAKLSFKQCTLGEILDMKNQLTSLIERITVLENNIKMNECSICLILDTPVTDSISFIVCSEVKTKLSMLLSNHLNTPIFSNNIDHLVIHPDRIKFSYKNEDVVFNDLIDIIKKDIVDSNISHVTGVL